MAIKYFFLIYLVVFSVQNSVFASNGSSGFGTARIGNTIVILKHRDLVAREGNFLINKQTNSKLLKITKVLRNTLPQEKLIRAQFGKLIGFEYLPDLKSNEKNYWIVCEKNDAKTCYRLDPIIFNDKLVPNILGTLDYITGSSDK